MKLLKAATSPTLHFGSLFLAAAALTACGGGGNPALGSVSGTAAVGAPLANASVQLACKNGTGSATANANGAYKAAFNFDGPCSITASSGAITIHSFAAGTGTYNVTPLTQLLLSYLAGQLGTTVDGLLAGITSNSSYQSALTNSTVIANAEEKVAQLLKTMYGITLSSSSFLTVSFTPGQPGADSDLDALLAAGAITSDGQPVASLAAAAVSAGAASPLPGNASGGATGGTGGTGTTTK
ncbi:carboxypeptidase regulatory-like domain-containing protein [Paraburkholderia xenovorans]|jgi:hypothetical protein